MKADRLRAPLITAVATTMVIALPALATSALSAHTSIDFVSPAAQVTVNAPNIVLVTTDDQTTLDLQHMPKTRRLLGERGVEFQNALSPHPLCCPARAELLTGQFAQNNGVRTNKGTSGGARALVDPDNTLPVWLQQAGYQTAFLGKYMNGYPSSDPLMQPAGWSSWNPSARRIYDYDDFVLNHNGVLRSYQGSMQADVYARATAGFVSEMAGEQPFFIWQSQLAPHGQFDKDKKRWVPPTSSPRNTGTFARQPLLSASSPSYNEADVTDKPLAIQELDPITATRTAELGISYQKRLESLQDVDDAVATLVRSLKEAGEYDETLIIFTSDNGYLLGEHRYLGKVFPYEEALRVPLLMSGPMVASGVVRQEAVTLVDIAPTILDAAGAAPGRVQDGVSLLPVASSDERAAWDTVLLQAGPSQHVDGGDLPLPDPAVEEAEDTNWLYRGVRTERYTYARYLGSGEVELYDRKLDPWQLDNVAADSGYSAVVTELAERTRQLSSCSGDCVRTWGAVPSPQFRLPR